MTGRAHFAIGRNDSDTAEIGKRKFEGFECG
jgi:hypothetical protein